MLTTWKTSCGNNLKFETKEVSTHCFAISVKQSDELSENIKKYDDGNNLKRCGNDGNNLESAKWYRPEQNP